MIMMDEWFKRGMGVMMAAIMALVSAILLKLEILTTVLVVLISFFTFFLIELMFTDKSDVEFEKDLKRLRGEVS